MTKSKTTYQYSWSYNNLFEILIDGENYFSSMLYEIKNAKNKILLEAYLFESGNTANIFINELCLAKKRNVDIYILLDEYGTKGLTQNDKNKLTESGIELFLYNPTSIFHFPRSLARDHRKLLIVDNHTAFIGGAGITDQFTPVESKDYWHDVMLKVQGEIVSDLTHSFNKVWAHHANEKYVEHKTTSAEENENKARVLISAGTEKNEITRSIIKRIRTSQERVWLTSPYFISSWKIRRALRFAAKKGVDVRLIFPGQHSDHKWINYGIQRYYQRLLKSNVSVYEFQPRFTHAKIILCDEWYTIGSSNLDRWNQFLNLDMNLEIYDERSHREIIKLFETDFSNSKKISLKKWGERSYVQRMKEIYSGVIIRILGYISQKFKR